VSAAGIALLTALCTLIVSIIVSRYSFQRTAKFQSEVLDRQEERAALLERYTAQREVMLDFERQRQITYTVKINSEQTNEKLADFAAFRARVRFAFGSEELGDQVAGVLCLHLDWRAQNIAVGARPPPEQIREREAWDKMYAHTRRVTKAMVDSINALEARLRVPPTIVALAHDDELADVLNRHRLAQVATVSKKAGK